MTTPTPALDVYEPCSPASRAPLILFVVSVLTLYNQGNRRQKVAYERTAAYAYSGA
jgi:hypothetical protein